MKKILTYLIITLIFFTSSCNFSAYFNIESKWTCPKCSEYIIFYTGSDFDAELQTTDTGTIITDTHGWYETSKGTLVSYKGTSFADTKEEDVTVTLYLTEKKVDNEWVDISKTLYFKIDEDKAYLSNDDYVSSSSDKNFNREYTSLFFK